MERNKSIHLVKHTNSSLTYKLIKDGIEKRSAEVLEAMDTFLGFLILRSYYYATLRLKF